MNEDFVNDKGFVLLPLANFFVKNGIALSNSVISVWPTLLLYANKDGKAWPSIATLAAYSGISKSSVLEGLRELRKYKWVKIISGNATSGWHNVYEIVMYFKGLMIGGEKATCFSIRRYLIRSGMWAKLPPSAKRLYLMLQAMSYPGVYDDNKGYDLYFNDKGEDLYVDYEYRKECEEEFPYTVIPWSKLNNVTYDTGAFIKLCGIESSRTYRDARSRLTDLGLIRAEDNGLVLPYFEHGMAEDVLARIDDIKRRNNDFRNTSASTKRFRNALVKRQRNGGAGTC